MGTASTSAPSTTSRKVRAILAGGVVLGVGAAVTLAAWTDQEWGVGEFGAGSFNIEGSTTSADADFSDHEAEAGAAVLGFDVAADNLSPGDAVAAPFVLRTDAETTYGASVDLTQAVGAGANAEFLSYGVTQVGSYAECAEGATGTEIVPAGTALSDATGATGFTLEAGAEGTAGAPVVLCFEVTAAEGLVQGETGTASWELTATSVE